MDSEKEISLIPSHVLSNKKLSDDAKIFFGIVYYHCLTEGFTTFTNREYMNLLNWKQNRVQKCIYILEKESLIEKKVIRDGYFPVREIKIR